MMIGKKKEVLSQILGPEKDDKEGGDDVSALHSCVQELIDAVHDKDVEGAVSALRACFADLQSSQDLDEPKG